MKKSWKYSSPNGKEVWKELEKISNVGYSNFFTDWLDLILASLLSLTDNLKRDNIKEKLLNNKLDGIYEERYLQIANKYKSEKEIGNRPIDFFANAWNKLFKETLEKQKDILGDIYQGRITMGEAGQFFTPEHITEAMAEMQITEDNKNIIDPCCGSGRFLISANKKNKNCYLNGIDIDNRCAKMCAINMWIFDCNATVRQGNPLTNEFYNQCDIRKGWFIYERILA